MEPALILPANASLGRQETIVRIGSIQVLYANALVISGWWVPLLPAESAWIRTKLTLTSPP